jgi:DNA-binding response OmpR family regulator
MPKVMLIEDDATMLSLLATLMEMEGYEVAQLGEGEIAVPDILENEPDLILMDVNLEGVNGIELLQAIRAEEYLGNTRVIMSSGMDYESICLEKGADGFILKPYMPDELIQLTKEILEE